MKQNDLERACAAARRGPEGAPELFRQLRESTVYFLMPYHPELGDQLKVGPGGAIAYVMWTSPDGLIVPVFTRAERAWKALENVGLKAETVVAAELRGEYLWNVIASEEGGQQAGVVINPASGPEEIFLPHDTVKELADGTILKPVAPRAGVEGRARPVKPADYPAEFLEPLWRFLRGRREVRAAWLLREVGAPDPCKVSHVFGLWLECDPEAATRLEQEFTVVAKLACPQGDEFGVMMLSPKDAATAQFMRKHPPFYAAGDLEPPGSDALN